jgi:hypothetical protein
VIDYHHRDVARVGKEQLEFLVSDYVDGEVLSHYLARQRGKRLPAFEALHLIYAITAGIEPIHYLGEYHGDIHSDNIMVSRRGLTFEVHLLDFFDFGRPTRQRMHTDVIDLVGLLYEIIGGADGYRRAGNDIKQIVLGRKHSLILKRYTHAGHLRLALENLEWND